MSRVLVVGMGVPGFVPSRRHGGPGLRAAHFATALARAGHEVLLVAVLDEGETPPGAAGQEVEVGGGNATPARVRVEFTSEPYLLSAAMRTRLHGFAPQAVVGATVYAASLATRLGLDVPLWADVFGDILAEAQAKAARVGSDWSVVHFWSLLRPVLERGDRFSAVSFAQAAALVGQLGMAGRLGARTAGEELVTTIPCAAESREVEPAGPENSADRTCPQPLPLAQGPLPAQERTSAPKPVDRFDGPTRGVVRARLGIAEDAFVLLCSGGVNTWCDVETLAAGVTRAMRAEQRLVLLVSGGAIPGHDENSWPALQRGLAEAPASRVHLLGWLPSARLAELYAASDLGLHIERPLYERTLGAENRVIEWLAHGLPCVTTARSEEGARLVSEGLAIACAATGDPAALAKVLLEAGSDARALRLLGERGRAWAARERSFAATTGPLVEWCHAPTFAGDRDDTPLLRLGLLSHPGTAADMLEAYAAALSRRELLRRGLRMLLRRALPLPSRRGAAVRGSVGSDGTAAPSEPGWPWRVGRALGLVAAVAAACLAAFAAAGCDAKPRTAAPRPNILLISIDTLRADRLGAYGHPLPTSPWIDALAARGIVVEDAVASAPETSPAVATLLTGLYQDRHRVVFNRAHLPVEVTTLAEHLGGAGYSTAAFVANRLVDDEHGFGQGFDRFDLVQIEPPEAMSTDDRLVATAGEFFRGLDPSRGGRATTATGARTPWFAWVHMMDPHGPYNSAPPWWSRDLDDERLRALRDDEPAVSESNFGLGVIPRYQKMEGLTRLSDYVRRYDGEVRFTDAQVGALLGLVAAAGATEDTLVVVTADHGESLVEHDELLQHGWYVYDTTVRIPLVLSWPAGLPAGRRVAAQACAVDLVPTLLEFAGVAADASSFDGVSLAGALRGDQAPPSRDCFSVGPRANHPFALRAGGFKFILTPAGAPTDPLQAPGAGDWMPEKVELYDLGLDPAETRNLVDEQPHRAQEMEHRVAVLRARFRAAGWRW